MHQIFSGFALKFADYKIGQHIGSLSPTIGGLFLSRVHEYKQQLICQYISGSMVDWLTNCFRKWFLDNNTHVANAYKSANGECGHITISFSGDNANTKNCSGIFSSFVKPSLTALPGTESNPPSSTIRIPYGQYHKEARTSSSTRMTIVSYDGQTLCENLAIPVDRSYIVTRSGSVVLQKYGDNVWVAEDGTNHHVDREQKQAATTVGVDPNDTALQAGTAQ